MIRNEGISKRIHLTFDYELFFEKSGTPEKCLLEPTERLLSVFKKHNIKGTFFIDVLYYLRLLEADETREVANKIRQQLQAIVAQGSRIELHLHPHWLDARYIDGEWEFPDYGKFRLQSLSEKMITDLFVSGTQVLEDIARVVQSDYKINAFRAGGFCIEPFSVLQGGFLASGITIDSSVAPGMFGLSQTHSFDFSSAPDLACYTFADNPNKMVHDAQFCELPIATYQKSLAAKLLLKLTTRFNQDRYKSNGDGKGLYFPIPLWRKFLPVRRMITLDGEMSPGELLQEVADSGREIITIISHPKSLSPMSFECLDQLVAAGHSFVDIQGAVNTLTKGSGG